jgi:hypothetical protein
VSKAIHFIVQQLHGFVASTQALLPAIQALGRPRKVRSSVTASQTKS